MKKKILVFDFKCTIPNRTYDAFYQSLQIHYDIFFYGPGYIPLEALEENLHQVYEKHGPFEATFVHRTVLVFHLADKNIKNDFVRYLFDIDQFVKLKPNFGQDYTKLPQPLFLISMLEDFYSFHDWFFETYASFPGFLLLPPPQCSAPIATLPQIHKESFYNQCNDSYIQFSEIYKHKIIPIAHLICDEEIDTIENKIDRVCIPGVLYHGRRTAMQLLRREHIPYINKSMLHKVIECIHKLRIANYANKYMQTLYVDLFTELLKKSLMSYTDGSKLRIFVRKFLEIPAAGSLMICEPFTNAHQFGFKDKENYIAVDETNLIDVVQWVLDNKDAAKKISDNGTELIKATFTATGFSNTLQTIINKAKTNGLSGAHWEQGQLLYH